MSNTGTLLTIILILSITGVALYWISESNEESGSYSVVPEYMFPDGTVVSSFYDRCANNHYVSIPTYTNFGFVRYEFFPGFEGSDPGTLYICGAYTDAKILTPNIVVIPIKIHAHVHFPTIVYTNDLADYLVNLQDRNKYLMYTSTKETSNVVPETGSQPKD